VENKDDETGVAAVEPSASPPQSSVVQPSDQQNVGDDVSQLEQAWHVQCKNLCLFSNDFCARR